MAAVKFSKKYYIGSFIINLLTAIAVLALLRYLPPVVPLFYGKPSGAEQLVGSTALFIGPLVGLVITALNLALAKLLDENFIQTILATASILISILITITVVKIILLVGFF